MAEMIGRTTSWLAWLAGAALALVFGSAGCGKDDMPQPVYGAPPTPPVQPAQPPQQPAPAKPAANLEESADWKVITDAWDFAKPLADSGKSTDKQRKAADARLQAAKEAAAALAALGLLNTSEAGLLAAEAEKIKADIYRNAPTDSEVICYQSRLLIPAQDSLARLNKRLPFLEALAIAGTIHKGTADKVLATIEADIATLSDEKKLGEIPEAGKRAEAEKTRDAVKAEIEKLKALLGPKSPPIEPPIRPMCYEMPAVPTPKPQSARQLDERLAIIDRLQSEDRLPASTADRVRARLLVDRAEAD